MRSVIKITQKYQSNIYNTPSKRATESETTSIIVVSLYGRLRKKKKRWLLHDSIKQGNKTGQIIRPARAELPGQSCDTGIRLSYMLT